MSYLEQYQFWCNAGLPADVKAELNAIKDDPEEMKSRFGRELEFGTAGLRGSRLQPVKQVHCTQSCAGYGSMAVIYRPPSKGRHWI